MTEKFLDPLEQQKAASLARFLQLKLREFDGETAGHDARIVAVAAAGLAGSYIFGLPDTLKRELVESYISTFRAMADVPEGTKQ